MKRTMITVALLAMATGGCNEETSPKKDGADTTASAKSSATTDHKEKGPKAGKGKDGKENVALAEAYADAVCACKKAQCINKAGEKYHEDTDKLYADRIMRTPTPEQKKKMDAASARVSECTDKLLKKK